MTALMDDIMISDKDTFDLTVYYKREGGVLFAVPGYTRIDASPDMKDMKELTVKMRQPDWQTAKTAVRNNTMLISGRSVIDHVSLRQSLFEMMAVSWNIVDAEGEPVALDLDSLGKTRPEIMRCFVEMLERKLVEQGIYHSIVNC